LALDPISLGCLNLGLLVVLALAPPLEGPAGPEAARVSALEATCQAGRVDKCLEAGRARLMAGDREQAVGSYAKACSGGLPEGCLGLATRYTGLAYEAQFAGRGAEAIALSDKGLALVRQAGKQRPNMVELAECEAWLCRLKATLARNRPDAALWTNRAQQAEARASALRAAVGGGFTPDVFWRPAAPPSPRP